MWNIVLSLCLLTTTGETPKPPDARMVTAMKRVTKAGGFIRGKVLASFVKKEMNRKQVEAILGEPTGGMVFGCVGTSFFRGGVSVLWGNERVTINGQEEYPDRALVDSASAADIWAALTGSDERRR
jgi:hypothetical protein